MGKSIATPSSKIKLRKRVGIPKGLIYYHYPEIFRIFFEELGAEVIFSKDSSHTLLLEALHYASDEECFSCKIFLGHIKDLTEKVDYLFLPKFHGTHKSEINCPKFIGLPDVIRAVFEDLPQLLVPYHSRTKKKHRSLHLIWSAFTVGYKITKNPIKITRAIIRAVKAQKKYEEQIKWNEEQLHAWELDTKSQSGLEKIKIVLLGHAYVLHDPILSFDIPQRLREMGVELITSEEMPSSIIEKQLKKLHSYLYFKEERCIVGSALYFLENETIDGILQLIPYPCGPTAISSEIIMRYAKKKEKIPLIQLMVDDNTGEAGLVTRLEAFVNTMKRKKLLQLQELHKQKNLVIKQIHKVDPVELMIVKLTSIEEEGTMK
ncbi:MAG: hypothetical protein HZR80_17955 [Candidatus Heimdallarchaeota archaeon]